MYLQLISDYGTHCTHKGSEEWSDSLKDTQLLNTEVRIGNVISAFPFLKPPPCSSTGQYNFSSIISNWVLSIYNVCGECFVGFKGVRTRPLSSGSLQLSSFSKTLKGRKWMYLWTLSMIYIYMSLSSYYIYVYIYMYVNLYIYTIYII